jgi:CheY-like chemotaxis protein
MHRLAELPVHFRDCSAPGDQSSSRWRTIYRMHSQCGQNELIGCLILLVDDHKDTLDAIRLFLEFRRAKVLATTAGQDGLDLVSRHRPEVIISDLSMPEMDGYELLQHVRQLTPEEGGDAPVIALTGCSDADERRKALDAGFARFLTKPVDPERLIDEICHVLESDIQRN